MLYELPKGWVKTTLGEIVVLSTLRAEPTESPDVPYISLEHIEPHTMKLIGHGYARNVHSSSVRFAKGDVLYGKMRPYQNKVWLAEFDGICSAEFLVFSKIEGLNNQFFAARLNADDFVTFANNQVSGERPRVDFEKLSKFPILLPSIAEQQRIVDKLNAALSGIQRAETAAQQAQERLKRYREAVLHAAVTGELTREWREKQERQNATIETGEDLLQRLLAARRARWEETESERLRAAGKMPQDDKWKSRYDEPVPPDVPVPTFIPSVWAWASLQQLGFIVGGLTKNQKRIGLRLNLPYLRVANVYANELRLENIESIGVDENELDKLLLEKGDLLIVEGNGSKDQIGRLAIWDGSIEPCVHQNHIIKVRLVEKQIGTWIISWLLSPLGRQYIEKVASSTTGLYTLSISKVGNLPIPLPLLAEQTEIIREVERRLEAADRLATKLEQKLAQSGETRQSLLREAFSGHIVPQDPNDELASALLERIRLEKTRLEAAQLEARTQSRRQKTSTRKAMKKSQLTPETLLAAFEQIGRKTDAKLLFEAVGCTPDEVITFYETLRATPEVRMAFEAAVQISHEQESALPASAEEPKPKGRFRLVELWLEDFKNLKDYTIRFDSVDGLDVVLGWNGTGKSNLFESLVIIFRDLAKWQERNQWPKQSMSGGYQLSYEIDEQLIQVSCDPHQMKRPKVTKAIRLPESKEFDEPESITRTELPLPHFVFGYYSGPTNRLAEHFYPMNQAHYVRLREATSDDPKILAALLEQRRFFCAETHHAKYVLLAFCYKEDPEISNFLRERLRITGFESVLFIIRKPRWGMGSPDDFWGAKGVMRRVLERLKRFAIAPMLVKQAVKDGYHMPKEDHYYFFLPDLSRLQSFADEYDDARTFFLALESLDFSELIYDVKIQVRVNATNTQEIPITFREMSEGEQQLLMVLGLMRFTKSFQSLVLLDEPDTHLNPHWSVDYLKMLTKIMREGTEESDEQRTSQILIATHDPLVIASLVKEQIHLLKRDIESLKCYWEQPFEDPRGLGFTGILTSEIFGFRSDLDPDTLALLDKQVDLAGKENLSEKEAEELENITQQVEGLGFKSASSDPYYRAFIQAIVRRQNVRRTLLKPTLTKLDLEALQRETDEILAEIEAEEAKAK